MAKGGRHEPVDVTYTDSGTALVPRDLSKLVRTADDRYLLPYHENEMRRTRSGTLLVPSIVGRETELLLTGKGDIHIPLRPSDLARTASGRYLVPYLPGNITRSPSGHVNPLADLEDWDEPIHSDDIFDEAFDALMLNPDLGDLVLSPHESDDEYDRQFEELYEGKKRTLDPDLLAQVPQEKLKKLWLKTVREKRAQAKLRRQRMPARERFKHIQPTMDVKEMLKSYRKRMKEEAERRKIKMEELRKRMNQPVQAYGVNYTSPYKFVQEKKKKGKAKSKGKITKVAPAPDASEPSMKEEPAGSESHTKKTKKRKAKREPSPQKSKAESESPTKGSLTPATSDTALSEEKEGKKKKKKKKKKSKDKSENAAIFYMDSDD